MGLHKVYTGKNRADAESADERVRARYDERNRRLFRVVIRQLDRDTIQAKKMRMMVKSEFGNDRDGYALLEYLSLWSNDLTQADTSYILQTWASPTEAAPLGRLG